MNTSDYYLSLNRITAAAIEAAALSRVVAVG